MNGIPRVVTVTSDGSLSSVALPGGADFVQNQTATPQAWDFSIGGNDYVAGNVGIGTTAPGQKLEVVGNVKISGAGNSLTFPDGSIQTLASTVGNLHLGTDGGNSATGLGQTVEFVGPGFNTDPASNASELRVVVGDGEGPQNRVFGAFAWGPKSVPKRKTFLNSKTLSD